MKIAETYLNIILKGPMKIMLMFLQETSTLSNEFPESNESAGFNVNEHTPSLMRQIKPPKRLHYKLEEEGL